jgi:transcriptional regulator with XRE-family HTH domain
MFRARAQLSQSEVAERVRRLIWQIDKVVVRTTSGMVSKWERGVKRPDVYNRRALCVLYSATEEQLGIGEGEVSMPTALRGKGMVEWLSDRLDVPISDLNREIDARSLAPAKTAPAGVSRESITGLLESYYGGDAFSREGFHLYGALMNGGPIRTTIAVRPAWVQGYITLQEPEGHEDGPIAEQWTLSPDRPPVTPMPDAILSKALDRLAQVAAAGADAPVMINKPLYSLRSLEHEADSLQATFAVDAFAHYALTYDLLEVELAEAIRSEGRPTLPLRDALLPDVRSVVDPDRRLCAGGVAGLFAMARPATRHRAADFAFVVQQRSGTVLNVAGRLSVMPKAFHQHLVSPADEVGVGTTLRRELEEELFGREDFDEGGGRPKLALNPYHRHARSVPMAWLADTGAATYQCTAAGLNLLTGNFEFACLITVTDERFWEQFSGSCTPNWEAAGIQVFSTASPAMLASMITDPRWTEEGLFALIQGLRALQQQYPDRVRLPDLTLALP